MNELTIEQYKRIFMQGETVSIVKYFDEIITKVLAEHFEMKKTKKGHIWYGKWNNHCRMVVSLFAAKGMFYYIEWGYNYDFIPQLNRQGKLVWHRTENAVRIHVSDSYISYVNYDELLKKNEKAKSLLEICYLKSEYGLNSYAMDVNGALESIENTVRRNIPFMCEWFNKIQTVDDAINKINQQVEHSDYYKFTLYYKYWTKAFLLARQNSMNEAIDFMQRCFGDREINPKILEKLYEANRNL